MLSVWKCGTRKRRHRHNNYGAKLLAAGGSNDRFKESTVETSAPRSAVRRAMYRRRHRRPRHRKKPAWILGNNSSENTTVRVRRQSGHSLEVGVLRTDNHNELAPGGPPPWQ
jgi:hypothetical protein